jgi:hypothetical protein
MHDQPTQEPGKAGRDLPAAPVADHLQRPYSRDGPARESRGDPTGSLVLGARPREV